jgi:hypothetical protein
MFRRIQGQYKLSELAHHYPYLSIKISVAKANLQGHTKTIPLVVHIDPVKKIVTRIEFEKGSGI